MPPVTASGPITVPLTSFRTMLSTLSSVQTVLGVVTANAALAKIYERTDLGAAVRPFLVVNSAEGAPLSGTIVSPGGPVHVQGGIEIALYADATETAWPDTSRTFPNNVGAVANDALVASSDGRAGVMQFSSWSLTANPDILSDRHDEDVETGETVRGEYWYAVVQFSGGVEPGSG